MNTTFENMGTTTINPHPTSIMIYMDGAPLVTIRPTGVIEYGPDYTPDAAAKAFWEAIGAGNPLQARVAELEMDAVRRPTPAMLVAGANVDPPITAGEMLDRWNAMRGTE